MKLSSARISILIGSDYTEINIEDDLSNTVFAKIKLTPEQLSQCLSRLACVKCECEVFGLDKLGKKHENESFEFEIPEKLSSQRDSELLMELCKKELIKHEMNDWIPDNYFGSQNSLFTRNNKSFARVTIRRWISL